MSKSSPVTKEDFKELLLKFDTFQAAIVKQVDTIAQYIPKIENHISDIKID